MRIENSYLTSCHSFFVYHQCDKEREGVSTREGQKIVTLTNVFSLVSPQFFFNRFDHCLTMATAASIRITATFLGSGSRRINTLQQQVRRTYMASHQVSGIASWDRTFGHYRDHHLPLLPTMKCNIDTDKSASSILRQTLCHNQYTTTGIPSLLSHVLHWKLFVSMRAFTKV